MTVGDILRSKSSRIATIRMNETVDTAAKLLRRENVGALVVKDVCRTEGNVVVGMFSERDVASAIADHGSAGSALPAPRSCIRAFKLQRRADLVFKQMLINVATDKKSRARAGAGRSFVKFYQ